MPVDIGSTTPSVAAVAMAASIALLPWRRIDKPAWVARGWLDVTIPRLAITSARDWAGQPAGRSPATAAQAAAVHLSLWAGALLAAAMPSISPIAIARIHPPFFVPCP